MFFFRILSIILLVVQPIDALAKSGASASSRKKDPISINIVGAAKSNGIAKYGVGLGYSLNSGLEMSLLVLGGKHDFKNNITLPTDTAIKSADGLAGQTTINARIYLGNSFSILAGGGYQQIRISSDIANSANTRSSNISLIQQNVVVNFGIGNQWSFRNGFNFGVDWGMMTVPIRKQVTSLIVSDGLSDAENAGIDSSTGELTTKLGKSRILSIGTVALGFRF